MVVGLFLAVPGIPTGVSSLKRIKPERLSKIVFRISWVVEDAYNFNFYGISNKEKDRYDLQIKKLQKRFGKLNYESYIGNNGGIEDSKTQHEIYLGMIKYIVDSI